MNYFDIDAEINILLQKKHLLQKHLEEKDTELEKLNECILKILKYLKGQPSSQKYLDAISEIYYIPT